MLLKPDVNKNEYIALEGNRRTAALQILENPDLLKDLSLPDALRNKLVDLADKFEPDVVEPIKAVLMPSREAARRWIELRHTGQNGGRGIVDWNGVQTARFRGDKMLKLVEFVKVKGSLTSEESAAVDNNFPITTLDRIISNPTVRQKIGIQIADGEFYFSYPAEQQIKIVKRIVIDLALKKINVSAVKNSDQQIAYVDSLPASVLPAGPKIKPPVSLADVMAPTPPPSPPQPPPPQPSPLSRKTLVPKGFALAIPNQKVAQIFYELRMLNLEKFPVSGATTMRSFVEATVDVYCSANSIPVVQQSGKHAGKALTLSEKVEAVLVHAGPKLTNQERTAARTSLTSKDSVISISRLHEYVHNPAMFPSKNDLVAAWSGVEAFFKVVCK